jgi:AraC-like DNA-binding protein
VQLHVVRDARAAGGTRLAPRPSLVFPLETTVVTLRTGSIVERVDRASFAVMPARRRHSVDVPTTGAIAVVTLELDDNDRKMAAREYAPDLELRRFDEVLASMRILPRTRWVDELVHRYMFEREVCERPASKAARFLETELAKEVYFLGREHIDRDTRASVLFEGDPIAAAARTWIEEHLFEPFRIDALVRHCHASESTVLRAFRKQLGVSPLAYLRRRRLEQAMQLLESGRYAVTEVATRVGYDNPSAFAAAFHKQFGVTPSRVRPSAATLPAHGRPPRRRRRDRG